MQEKPLVGIIMGSQSDWPILCECARTLDSLKISFEAEIVSAHRTPDKLYEYARNAADRGIQIIIAGAGGAAHLPGMIAAMTRLPVFGVPIPSSLLNGLDSLLSIVQMPAGVPVGTLAVGKAGAINSALLAAAILANNNTEVCERLEQYRAQQTQKILDNNKPQLESL
ncbi:5-(carboxyamino)imidazole ribonucleotide mutase [Legionella anisa]|uniref:N5-carboxyaminoimidazole ribonucleotide mutase n=1 Tax=Legionella anisa TaxID=28082 RepID=A0AAX0WPH1_9GAMM|nr:5-(carboxyamino)imidazole ribonucleotide mutase [Legionella anisa]AWN73055.1 5-(carboxyamino)imidazole ribonucleotide mutase [Legionella anisa]KTC67514.1 phosphoribosylaminoimidazole carboxylase, catalytic subunit PurE [Legionella anisa]MBN5936264.1 5-(carboxyamino)imidazole ribonucleotide mutase [Legionella anisa]MCW8423881.1 5-(carboxyamino)imidazole ribonucleotide mutase [Legionella anisa]MCW8447403.1 5-(carboxyamino)imidazole ribonucleotide mutase [Legionella anisa]